jgi:hypothetical protein
MRSILTKLGILTIALAMVVGVATAAPAMVKITPQHADIPYDPGYVTYNVDVYEIFDPGEDRAIVANVFSGPTGMTTHLKFRFTNSLAANSGWIKPGKSWNWGKPQHTYEEYDMTLGYENLTMDVKALTIAPGNSKYGLQVVDIDPGSWDDKAEGTTYGSSIPEFTTIAGPVGAIMGLFLFFNYRKRRKE